MKTMKCLITIFCLLVVIGCTEEDFGLYDSDIKVMADMGYSRTVFTETDGVTQVSWEQKDAIGLYTASQTNLKYTALAAGAKVEFEHATTRIEAMEGDTVYAYYPWNSASSGDSVKVKNFRVQEHKDTGNDYGLMNAMGVVSDNSLYLKFCHLVAYLKVTIPTDRFPNLKQGLFIRSTEPMSSEGCYYPKENRFSQTSDHIFYEIEEGDLQGKNNIVCYMAILPQSEGVELQFCEYKNWGSGEILFRRMVPEGGIKAGYVYTLNMETQAEIDSRVKRQRDALVALYEATNGDNWINNTNWCTDKPINQWYGITSTESGEVTALCLQNNNLTGHLPTALADLESVSNLELYNNQLTGEVPQEVMESPMWNNVWDIARIVWQKGPKCLIYNTYESTDYSKDGQVYCLQEHSKGQGIKIIITGDGYSDRLIDDGTYDAVMREAMEAFFSREPYCSLREYFDVYVYTAVSKGEVIDGNTAFGTMFTGIFADASGHVASDSQLVIQKLKKILPSLGRNDLKDMVAIVVLNSTAGYRNNCIMFSDGFSLGNTMKHRLNTTLVHEACGHGFAFLADEYVESGNENATIPESQIQALKYSQERGRDLNVDVTNNAEEVLWAPFLKDERYKNENLGLYEGANYYSKGVYRPSENSIMRSTIEGMQFNAQSRWIIYQRVMDLAGEKGTFEQFLELDEPARKIFDNWVMSRSPWLPMDTECASKYSAPPVIYDYPSSMVGN